MWLVRVESPWACFGLEVTDDGWIARLPAPRPMLASSSRAAGRLPGRQSAYHDREDARPGQPSASIPARNAKVWRPEQ